MSTAEEYDSVQVSAEGVRVVKRFAADEFPVPAIAFDIYSDRNETVTLVLSDVIPDAVDVEDLGFHPDYGSEFWTIGDGRITFEREFEPDGSYTTVYGVRAVNDISPFLEEPSIEEVDPPLSDTDGELVLEGEETLVEDAIPPEDESERGETDEIEIPATLDLGDPSGSASTDDDSSGQSGASNGGTSAEAASTDGGTSAEGTSADGSTTAGGPRSNGVEGVDDSGAGGLHGGEGSLVAALAAEIRTNDVPQEHLDQLREVLAEESEPTAGPTVARLDQLQQDIADLRAYKNSLEEFLEENGTGKQVIESVEGDLASLENRLEQLETEFVGEVRDRTEELEGTFATLESEVTAELDRLDELESDVERLEELESEVERVEELESEVERVEELESEVERLEELESDVERLEELESEVERLEELESDVERLEELESEVERVEELESEVERVEELESKVERVEELESEVERLEELESDLESLRNWKEQLIKTLGS